MSKDLEIKRGSSSIYIMVFFVGVVLGTFTNHGCKESTAPQYYNRVDNNNNNNNNFFYPARRLTSVEETKESLRLVKLSEQQFSCNAQRAFEELTQLHLRAKRLAEHNTGGDANRARIGTIARKYGAARSAETAFRSCVSDMMPDLLRVWDSQLEKGLISARSWKESDEILIDGITFKTLEETADYLERVE